MHAVDRPVVDGRHLDPVPHRRPARPVRGQRRPDRARDGPRGDQLHVDPVPRARAVAGRSPPPSTQARRPPGHRARSPNFEDVTPNGTSYPLTEKARSSDLLRTSRTDPVRATAGGAAATFALLHPYTEASAEPVQPGQVTEYQIEVFPTLVTIGAGDRLRLPPRPTRPPHAAARGAPPAGRRRVHDRALRPRTVVPHAFRAARPGRGVSSASCSRWV